MFTIELKGFERAKKLLDSKKYERAVKDTIKDLARAIRTEISQALRERYTLPASRIREDIIFNMINEGMFRISFRRRPPGLQHYKAYEIRRGIKYTATRRGIVGKQMKRAEETGGVYVEVIRGRRVLIRRAFMKNMPKGGWGVWITEKNTRKLRRLFGPSIGGGYRAIRGHEKAVKILQERADRVWRRNVERHTRVWR